MLKKTSILAISLYSFSSFAATVDGTLGNPSTGTKDISVTIAALAKISNISATDAVFGTWSGSGDLEANDEVCIFSNFDNGGTKEYHITATGNGTGSAFALTGTGGSGAGDEIPYKVYWRDQTGGTSTNSTELTTTTALVSQTQTGGDPTCSTDNATLSVKIEETTLQAASDSAYAGVLTISISPE